MSDFTPSSWFIDDEPRNARYYFIPVFNITEEPLDIDETITERSLVDIQVLVAEEFDERGHVHKTWNQPDAGRFNDRAWKLLSRETSLREYLEEHIVQAPSPMAVSSTKLITQPESAASTMSKMREQRHTNQAQEKQTKRRPG